MRSLRFRIVALVAAYALALHVVLLAFLAVAPTDAAPHIAGLCSGLSADQNNAPPGSHDAACAVACAMLASKMAAPAAPVVALAEPIVAVVFHPITAHAPRHPVVEAQPRARAPPVV